MFSRQELCKLGMHHRRRWLDRQHRGGCRLLCGEEPRIRYLYQDNRGLSGARNAGLRLARGEFLQLLDADDLFEREKLARQAEYLETHREVDIVYGDAGFFDSAQPALLSPAPDGEYFEWMDRISGSGSTVLPSLVRKNLMVVHAALFRRDVLSRVGLFDESLRVMEDWEFWMRCALSSCRFEHLSGHETLALVRGHRASLSRNRIRMLTAQIELRERLKARLPSTVAGANAQALAEARAWLGVELIKTGKHAAGWSAYVRAVSSARNPAAAGRYFFYLLVPPRILRVLKRCVLSGIPRLFSRRS